MDDYSEDQKVPFVAQRASGESTGNPGNPTSTSVSSTSKDQGSVALPPPVATAGTTGPAPTTSHVGSTPAPNQQFVFTPSPPSAVPANYTFPAANANANAQLGNPQYLDPGQYWYYNQQYNYLAATYAQRYGHQFQYPSAMAASSPAQPFQATPAQPRQPSRPLQRSATESASTISRLVSDSDMSLSSTESTSTITSKRRRPNDDEQGRTREMLLADTSRQAPATEASNKDHSPPQEYGLLSAQLSKMQDQLLQIAQGIQTPCVPQALSLSSDEGLVGQLLQGIKETNDLLRSGLQPQAPTSNGAQASTSGTGAREGGSGDEDVAMKDSQTSTIRVVGSAKRGPVARSQRSVITARQVREFFKEIFRGQVENHAGWQPDTGPCCTVEDFRLDLTKPPCDKWNLSAKKVFTNAFLGRDDPQILALMPTKEEVDRLFVSNFRNARLKDRWFRSSEDEKGKQKQKHRRQERKRWLYYRRVTAAERYEQTKRHLPLLAAYGVDGMSTDESNHDNGSGRPIFNIHNKKWRHPHAINTLHTLDALHRDSRFRPIRKNTPGAHPHERRLSSVLSTSAPVPRLPSSLYDPDWLHRQSDIIKQDLEVYESTAYDFSHDPYIVALSKMNNGKLDSIHGYA
ncbi:hypothetical protein EST38_g2591 [Candolleomyces aberdarensis]|uniref:Uncharacterized protein n=1 Tax=Candolleomyces aberdarensis TaxID=2316362 RepID=A0A4Q2DVM9_9AGAR|nr:hypothetical protein EST38_g2591 [Candolleomyces aberdarensis]